MTDVFSPYLIFAALQATTPLLLAALAGLLCSRVGVFNMALEGQMLVGAFAGVAVAFSTGSDLAGLLAAMIATMAFSVILAAGTTVLRANPVVVCIGMNLLASGLTAYLLRIFFGVSGTFADTTIPPLRRLALPLLAELGPYGAAFNYHTLLTYLSWLLAFGVFTLLYFTPMGLRLRGTGENPDAAASLGINVDRLRFLTVTISGALVGLAGAQLSLGTVTMFSEDMSAGRGWIALVAVMLSRARPLGAALACLLFGLTDAMGLRLQSFGVPNQLTDILPYVITLCVLVLSSAVRKKPEAA